MTEADRRPSRLTASRVWALRQINLGLTGAVAALVVFEPVGGLRITAASALLLSCGIAMVSGIRERPKPGIERYIGTRGRPPKAKQTDELSLLGLILGHQLHNVMDLLGPSDDAYSFEEYGRPYVSRHWFVGQGLAFGGTFDAADVMTEMRLGMTHDSDGQSRARLPFDLLLGESCIGDAVAKMGRTDYAAVGYAENDAFFRFCFRAGPEGTVRICFRYTVSLFEDSGVLRPELLAKRIQGVTVNHQSEALGAFVVRGWPPNPVLPD